MLIALAVQSTQGTTLRLLLVPTQSVVKPHAKVTFDMYLCNENSKPATAPTFQTVAKDYVLRDIAGKRLPRGHSSSLVFDHPAGDQVLQPNSIQRKRIEMAIPAEPGDLVEVHVEIGIRSVLRSNSVFLFCPNAKGKFE